MYKQSICILGRRFKTNEIAFIVYTKAFRCIDMSVSFVRHWILQVLT